MKSDKSNGEGLADRGPRIETTMDMSAGRLLRFDPGASVPRRELTREEREWLARGSRFPDTPLTNVTEERDDTA